MLPGRFFVFTDEPSLSAATPRRPLPGRRDAGPRCAVNELGKLLSSLILLGAGFFAASLVGPPEVVQRLAHYLQPTGNATSGGLRPVAADAPPVDFAGWPAEAPPAGAPRAASLESTGSMPPVAAMFPPTEWGAASAESAGLAAPLPSPWSGGGAGAPPEDSAPSTEWLTGVGLAAPSAIATRSEVDRPLTPVPRGAAPAVVAEAPSVETPPAAASWPELRAPQAPELPAWREVTAAKPASESTPYDVRPRFADSLEGASADPLGRAPTEAAGFAPLPRVARAESYHRHVVTDGDTLETLAARYLGDASRAGELFDLNRDRLDQPDVLPIGMVLLAPKRSERSTGPAGAPSGAPAGGAATAPRGDFATVSAGEFRAPQGRAVTRALAPVGSVAERPLSEAERLGPADAHYDAEATWDANRW